MTSAPTTWTEARSTIKKRLDPVMHQLGFSPEMPATWRKDDDEGQLFVWLQEDSKARDPYAGRAFTVEFERASAGRRPQEGLSGRARLDQLLRPNDLVDVIGCQNRIIASLAPPPENHVQMIPEFLRNRYMQSFEPQLPYRPGDLWLRFRDREHAELWANVLSDILPRAVVRAAAMRPDVLYLGKPLESLDGP